MVGVRTRRIALVVVVAPIVFGCGKVAAQDTPGAEAREKEARAAFVREVKASGKEVGEYLGLKFVKIPTGEFLMGPRAHKALTHKVEITKAFEMSAYEVTQAQWAVVMGTKPWTEEKYSKGNAEHAASGVDWDDCQEFIARLNAVDGPQVYGLPTEAQWEYCCRAGSIGRYCFGNDVDVLGEYAWYRANARNAREMYAHPVGRKKPNAWGLYDMHGNVWEWCQDWYDANHNAESSEQDPKGPANGVYHMLRGGAWQNYASSCCAGFREVNPGGYLFYCRGFRPVRVAAETP